MPSLPHLTKIRINFINGRCPLCLCNIFYFDPRFQTHCAVLAKICTTFHLHSYLLPPIYCGWVNLCKEEVESHCSPTAIIPGFLRPAKYSQTHQLMFQVFNNPGCQLSQAHIHFTLLISLMFQQAALILPQCYSSCHLNLEYPCPTIPSKLSSNSTPFTKPSPNLQVRMLLVLPQHCP